MVQQFVSVSLHCTVSHFRMALSGALVFVCWEVPSAACIALTGIASFDLKTVAY